MKYINSCNDTTPPIEIKNILINHQLYFANKSCLWDNKGVAFINPKEDKNEVTLGVMYLITKEQFKQIKQQEGSKYKNEIQLGYYDNREIITFTDYEIAEKNNPSEKYLDTIRIRIKQNYRNLTSKQITNYLDNKLKKRIQN